MPQRSHHYNWFRGQDNITDPKENFKQQAKTVWKFVKIFLYFMLFFFSMWGCVQVFTHRVSTKPASGITLTNGDDKLSPQVSEYIVNKDAGDRFYFTKTGVNYVPTNKNEGLQTITNVNKQLKEDLGVKSPTKARKGGNYIIKLEDSNGKKIGATKNGFFVIQQNADNSKNQDKMLIYTTADIKNKKDKYYSFENSLKILQTLAPSGITRYKINLNSKKIEDVDKIDFKNEVEMEKLKNKLSNKNELAFYFNTKILEAIYKHKKDWFEENLFEPMNYKKGQVINQKQINDIYKRKLQINFLLSIIAESGNFTNIEKMVVDKKPLGFSQKTNWIPITNWAKAWDKDGGTGPFYGVFVYPIAFVTNELINSLPSLDGWESLITIVVIVVTLSVIMFLLNFKNTLQQTKIQELSAKKAIIDAKYAPYKGNKQMENRQRQEVASIYKKEGISPLSQIGSLFLRMPFFLAMWRVIGAIDHIKATEWIGINFATTSWRALLGNFQQWDNGWSYFPLIALAVGLQLLSTMLPKILNKRRNKDRMNVQQREAMKKSDRTQKIMMMVTLFFPLITSAGVQVYFIIRSIWTIFEQLLTHKILTERRKRKITLGIK